MLNYDSIWSLQNAVSDPTVHKTNSIGNPTRENTTANSQSESDKFYVIYDVMTRHQWSHDVLTSRLNLCKEVYWSSDDFLADYSVFPRS